MKQDKKVVYLVGSLGNRSIIELANEIRSMGFDCFDDWIGPGEEADEKFNQYRKRRGLNYRDAIKSWAAQHIFEFDRKHIERADIVILIMPAGKSGHLELGYAACWGRLARQYDPPFIEDKKTYILMHEEPERVDIMHAFADDIFMNKEDLLKVLNAN